MLVIVCSELLDGFIMMIVVFLEDFAHCTLLGLNSRTHCLVSTVALHGLFPVNVFSLSPNFPARHESLMKENRRWQQRDHVA